MNLLQLKIRRIREQEALDPLLHWGVRMGLAVVIPLVIGNAFDLKEPMDWVALTAETICWVELKGGLKQRIRMIMAGALLASFFTGLGSLTAFNLWLSMGAMLVTGFMAGLFKNLGDRGSGLSICVGAMFIISNALPAWGGRDLVQRMGLTLLAGAWVMVLEALLTLRSRKNEAFRRSIGRIWQAITDLLKTVSTGWQAGQERRSARDVYREEAAVRQALDASMVFHQTLSDQLTAAGHRDYNLIMARKTTALVATHVTAIGEAVEGVNLHLLPAEVQSVFNEIWSTYERAAGRMSSFLVSLEPEEAFLLQARLNRLEALTQQLRNLLSTVGVLPDAALQKRFERAAQLVDRSVGLMRHLITLLPSPAGEPRAYQSYSLMKTIYALHPGFLLTSVRTLFQFKTENFRYALRLAGALTIALFCSKYLQAAFSTRNAYWLPFTVLLIVQPYIGATLKKSLDRIIGTLAGGVVGGVLLFLPTPVFSKEILLFASSVLMIYYLKKNYAVAAFFITVSLVMLLAVEESASAEKILMRGVSTIAGAAIAIGSGFLLLPTWDRRKLPLHLAAAFEKNYAYLCFTLRTAGSTRREWLQHKRQAEQANSRAFESFQRYLREPDVRQKVFIAPYQVLTHNMRLTRELNQLQLEREIGSSANYKPEEALTDKDKELGESIRSLARLILKAYQDRGSLTDIQCERLDALDGPLDIRPGEEELLEQIGVELSGLKDSMGERMS